MREASWRATAREQRGTWLLTVWTSRTDTHQALAQGRSDTTRASERVRRHHCPRGNPGPPSGECGPRKSGSSHLTPGEWRHQCKGRESWQTLLHVASSRDDPSENTRMEFPRMEFPPVQSVVHPAGTLSKQVEERLMSRKW